jgi:hypothetical protein
MFRDDHPAGLWGKKFARTRGMIESKKEVAWKDELREKAN